MTFQHRSLASGRWFKFNLMEQLANIGSEVERATLWKEKHDFKYSREAFFRALELLSLSIDDPKNRFRLKELTRLYECLVDYFMYDNQYRSSDALWRSYFYAFNFAVRNKSSRRCI